jgi:hypothetical protein
MMTRRRFVMPTSLVAAALMTIAAASLAEAEPVSYDFRPPPQNARTWLASQGFEFKMDANNAARARFSFDERGLIVQTLGPAEPIIAQSKLAVAQPARLVVSWGVSRYPAGANWDVGVNNEPIMIMTFFGNERLPGGLFMPPSPYFIGFFLCQSGRRGVPISGRSYTRQGRYVCLDGPAAGAQITSTVALDQQFRAAFHAAAAPPVTGLAIEADTTQVRSDGRSEAWIRSIAITPRQ